MSVRVSISVVVAVLVVAGCQGPGAADTDYAAELKPAMDTFIETWNTGNLALLDNTIPDDFRRTAPDQDINSRAELEAVMTGFRAAYPDLKVVADDAHFAKDRAYVHWTFTGTNTGPGDAPPTNKPVKLRGYTTLHYENGKIAFEDVYFDALDWNMQLGATLTPPGA